MGFKIGSLLGFMVGLEMDLWHFKNGEMDWTIGRLDQRFVMYWTFGDVGQG